MSISIPAATPAFRAPTWEECERMFQRVQDAFHGQNLPRFRELSAEYRRMLADYDAAESAAAGKAVAP